MRLECKHSTCLGPSPVGAGSSNVRPRATAMQRHDADTVEAAVQPTGRARLDGTIPELLEGESLAALHQRGIVHRDLKPSKRRVIS